MFVTFEVLSTLMSRDFKDLQPMNMPTMVVTFEVLKLLRSIESKEWQLSNR